MTINHCCCELLGKDEFPSNGEIQYCITCGRTWTFVENIKTFVRKWVLLSETREKSFFPSTAWEEDERDD